MEDVAQRTYAAFVQRFFRSAGLRARGALGSRGTVATGQLFAAAPASPFDRWHVRWSGPERLQPRVRAFVHRWEGVHATTVRLDAGLADPVTAGRGEWQHWLDELLDEARGER